MRFIRKYIMKYKLAAIFNQAEQLSLNGVEAGDERYVALFDEAMNLLVDHENRYPGFQTREEIPGMCDLEKLTHAPEPTDPRKYILPAALGVFAFINAIGLLAASVSVSYHGWMHLFHWLRMV